VIVLLSPLFSSANKIHETVFDKTIVLFIIYITQYLFTDIIHGIGGSKRPGNKFVSVAGFFMRLYF